MYDDPAGGTHHAFRATGSGYCIINDLAITAETLLARRQVDRVLILDLDVHQGDGTAAIMGGREDVFTCSFHAENNFPSRKQCSTLDVGFEDGTTDDGYLRCAPVNHGASACNGLDVFEDDACKAWPRLPQLYLDIPSFDPCLV